jgi:hypothetical protein
MIIKPFGPIAGAYIQDASNRAQVIVGPVGSAKTTASCVKAALRAYEQKPDTDGISRVRVAVVRNTRRQLLDTTLKTWLQVFPESEYGLFQQTAMVHRWQFRPKGYSYPIDAEFVFRALDDEADVTNLLSAEYTFAYFNEVREINEEIISHMGRRVGRFPGSDRCSYFGWFGDTNSFGVQHHLYSKLVIDPRQGWKLYKQPGGLDQGAENIENLPGGKQYYLDAMADYSPSDADVYVHCKWAASRHGKPVFVSYNDVTHCKLFSIDKFAPLLIGYDCSGQNPAAVIAQKTTTGQWLIIREFPGEDIGVKAHAEAMRRYIASEFPGYSIARITCDPAGEAKDAHGLDNVRIIRDVFRGVATFKALTNDPRTRVEAVDGTFRRMINGGPAILIHPECKVLRMACLSEYKFRKLKLPGNQFSEEPQKLHPWSDVADALQYLLLGGGEGRAAMGGGVSMSPEQFSKACASRSQQPAADWSPFQ